ncbi:PhzF family phenazine biosynthesis isomerase [Roseovarius salis]|uniref:PhzF family phenazine biosynthesis protein n=1 Tax=Roseovarius salis TaxID=3376063 RepID=UPI0037C6E174
MKRYYVYDVFTKARFGGNQLAVFPDAAALPETDLQRIAAEFNFSEVVFCYPAHLAGNTARLRIFTPTMEVPFAGHPLIGTAVMLADLGHGPDMVLELHDGPLPCTAARGEAAFTTAARLEFLAEPDPALVARALGLVPADIATTTHAPVMASLGLPFTITELASRKALSACQPDIAAFRAGALAHPGGLDFAQFAYVRDGGTVHARMFAPLDNIPEDPATGSAGATLAALLADRLGRDMALTVRQGDDMGRPGRIGLRTASGTVTVSGQAVQVMRGELV